MSDLALALYVRELQEKNKSLQSELSSLKRGMADLINNQVVSPPLRPPRFQSMSWNKDVTISASRVEFPKAQPKKIVCGVTTVIDLSLLNSAKIDLIEYTKEKNVNQIFNELVAKNLFQHKKSTTQRESIVSVTTTFNTSPLIES